MSELLPCPSTIPPAQPSKVVAALRELVKLKRELQLIPATAKRWDEVTTAWENAESALARRSMLVPFDAMDAAADRIESLRSALEASNKALRRLAIGPVGGFFGYRGCSICNVSWAKDKEETHAVGCPARALAPSLVDGKEKS